MKQTLLYLSFAIAVFAINQNSIAQGCVAVRQMGGVTALNSMNSYNLKKGDITVGTAYRYFHSWRHFVGTEEQPQRQTTGGGHDANGKQLGNAVNIYSHAVDINLSYGISDRLQFNVTIPYVNNERSQVLRQTKPKVDTMRYSVYAKGLADVRASLNYWLMDPKKAHRGNVMVGLGIKLATGSHSKMDDAPQTDGTRKSVLMDQAIQPGDGGVGFSVELSAFRQLTSNIYGFANGYYLFNPRTDNGSFKSAAKVGLEGYEKYASPDQYFVRAGVMSGLSKSKNLTVSLAGRFEGIPAYDALGGQVAYRRPGYVVAVEPGVTYRKGQHTFSVFVPYNFIKNRIQSAADIAQQNLTNAAITDATKKVHVQGDAAFADYSLNVSYSYRIGKKHKMPIPIK
jgi:hypothetical protein